LISEGKTKYPIENNKREEKRQERGKKKGKNHIKF